MENQPKTAVLLIAHGSRHADANSDTQYLAAALEHPNSYPIAVAAFLEIAKPDIDTGAAICVERGAECVILLPHFLSAGLHVQRDLAAAHDRLTLRFPRVQFRLADPIGRHPGLLDALRQRAQEA